MSHLDDHKNNRNKNGHYFYDTTPATTGMEEDVVELDRIQQQHDQYQQEKHKRERIAASILDDDSDSDNDEDDDHDHDDDENNDELLRQDRMVPLPSLSSSSSSSATTTWTTTWMSMTKRTTATRPVKSSSSRTSMSLRSLPAPAKHQMQPPRQQEQSMLLFEDGSHSAVDDDDDDGNDGNDPYATLPQEKIAAMSNMMLELVRDIVQVRPGDQVLTRYGVGELVKKSVRFPTDEEPVSSTTLQIQFSWGALYHRQPDMVHKVMALDEYEQAMDHLEQVRKLQLAVQCQQWNVPIVQDACVACLFQKPETVGSNSSTTGRGSSASSSSMAARRRRWQWSSSRNNNSASSSFSSSDNHNNNNTNNNSSGTNHDDTVTTNSNNNPVVNTAKVAQRCDVCGNPVCQNHIMHNQDGSKELFVMCVDCSFDLTQLPSTLAANHPQLQANLDRLLQYYIRMVLQLSFCVPNLNELADQLTERDRRHSRFALGTNAVGFVGAALGVAGAATLLTPAGPAILLAAIATQATSGVMQGGHAMAKRISNKEANRLADRVLGWHGLCLGILQALEQLRRDLLVERDKLCNEQDNTDLLNQLLASGRRNISTSEQALQVWNVLAYGTYQTTRQGLTGVAMTAQMGASYSQVLTTGMQTVPVVGAAFSVGCMAMDATNIASTLSRMQKPSEKSVALRQVVTSFSIHIPSTIQAEVEGLLAAIMDLRERQEEAQQIQEKDLIEQELEELNML